MGSATLRNPRNFWRISDVVKLPDDYAIRQNRHRWRNAENKKTPVASLRRARGRDLIGNGSPDKKSIKPKNFQTGKNLFLPASAGVIFARWRPNLKTSSSSSSARSAPIWWS